MDGIIQIPCHNWNMLGVVKLIRLHSLPYDAIFVQLCGDNTDDLL